MKKIRLFLGILLVGGTLSCMAQEQSVFNFDIEQKGKDGLPDGWLFSFGNDSNNGYSSGLDSNRAQRGRYAIRIEQEGVKSPDNFGVCGYKIPATFEGKTIKLTGYLKTENVTEGYAGLWMRIDGTAHNVLGFDNMQDRGLTGTTDWKQYTIEYGYNSKEAGTIFVGALLTGKGKLWMDNLDITMDGIPLAKAPARVVALSKADKDSLFDKGSGIAHITAGGPRLKLYNTLGMLWGFMKYYHPAVAKGDFNMDAELFRLIPKMEAAETNEAAFALLETWVDRFGAVDECKNCSPIDKATIKLEADYGTLFQAGYLPETLQRKLAFIKDNRKPIGEHYYIGMAEGVGNPVFKNEKSYQGIVYPDAGLRLLALYRYWNMVQYFYPDRHLISGGWHKVLEEFIPQFVNAPDEEAYTLVCLKLITRVGDTHANIWGSNKILDQLKGKNITPFKAVFIAGKLVVADYYRDTNSVKELFHIGDIIERIDGVPVDTLVKRYLSMTPASNYETQLRDMPSTNGFLLRSDRDELVVTVVNAQKQKREQHIKMMAVAAVNRGMDWEGGKGEQAYQLLDNNIGYIYPARLKDDDIDKIKKELGNTKGIIIDLRCYPTSFMPFTYGKWLKGKASPFVKFTGGSLTNPGMFTYSQPLENGSDNTDHYQGKVVLLVNAITQSQAEYTAMALCSVEGSKVIGNKTAGADGNVSGITLPGGIYTMISGIGVLYPDNSESQRLGVKIDKVVNPTIEGLRLGKDELLEEAIKAIHVP